MGRPSNSIMTRFGMAFCLFAAASTRSSVRAFGTLPSFATRTASSTKALFSTSATSEETEQKELVPITLLSGFLGSGKTTALKNLLENREGVKIGVIVNDVASVNIDAKLISNPGNDKEPAEDAATDNVLAELGGTVELQNGCACCSLSDELLTSLETLMDGRDFDAVVVELSGVADPVAVKQNWEQAKMMGHAATNIADINRVVTMVDACTFGTDWMTWNTAGERDGWTDPMEDCTANRKVPELLAEQVEAADLLLVNKIDMAGEEQVKIASDVARNLNSKADVYEVEFGVIAPKEILGGGIIPEKKKEEEKCSDPGCTDASHDHSHSHDHDSSCSDPACSDPKCTDASHDHSHSHDHDSACSDPDCTDTSHSHSHDHAASNTSTDKLGISNFVYKSSLPFDTGRLLGLLNQWPVPIKDDLDFDILANSPRDGYQFQEGLDQNSPFIGVLRSKGFCWMAPTMWEGRTADTWRHDTANYWSHAGKHFGITTAGKWWATLPKDKMKVYFAGNMKEFDRIMNEDWATEEFGDRRQEIVFIGANIDQEAITEALNKCLLTDEEMAEYRQQLEKFVGV